MSTTRPIQLPPQLADLLKKAAEAGASLPVMIDDRRYHLVVVEDRVSEEVDMWSKYDVGAVRAAIERSKSMKSHADPADIDPLISDIRSQRDQSSREFDD